MDERLCVIIISQIWANIKGLTNSNHGKARDIVIKMFQHQSWSKSFHLEYVYAESLFCLNVDSNKLYSKVKVKAEITQLQFTHLLLQYTHHFVGITFSKTLNPRFEIFISLLWPHKLMQCEEPQRRCCTVGGEGYTTPQFTSDCILGLIKVLWEAHKTNSSLSLNYSQH